MQEIEIPPRDCFKYYVQVEGAPKTILWNFATKKKNIAFGLFFQLSSDSLDPSAPAPTPVTAVPGNATGSADPVAAATVASPRLNLNFSSASSARSSPRHSPAASLSAQNNNPFTANNGALIASPHLEVPPSSSDAGGGSSLGITDSSDADTVVNGSLPPPIRYESSKSTIKGQQLVMRDGTYVLYFDNTFSRNTSKKMTFFVAMRDGEAPKEDQPAPELTGWLLKKKRKRMQGWAKRYFTCDRGQLSYMKLPGGFCRGSVPIALSTISVDPDHRIINIDSGTTLWHLRAFTREDYDKWIAVIKRYKAEHAEVVRAVAAAAAAGPAPPLPIAIDTTTSPISDHQTIRATPASPSSSSPSIDHLMRQFIASVDSHVDHLARLVLTADPQPAPELVNTVKALAQVLHAEKDELLDQLACESAKAATVAQAYAEILRENSELRARFDVAGGPSMSASGSATVVPPPSQQPARAMTPPGYHPSSSGSLTAAQQQVIAAHRSLSMTSFSAAAAANRMSGSVGATGMHMRTGSIASTISDQWFDAEEIVLTATGKGGAKGKGGDGSDSESSDDSDQRSVKGKAAAAAKRVSTMAAAGKSGVGHQQPMSPEMVVNEAGVDATSPSSMTGGPDSSAAVDASGTGTGEGTDDEEDEDDEYAYDEDEDDDDDDDESGYMVDMYATNGGGASPTVGAGPRSLRGKRSASSLGSKSLRNVSVFQGGYHVARRKYLPSPVVGDDVSLLGILRKNVGKDLSTVAMPISLNEPINLLQKLAEELEYSHLLDRRRPRNLPTLCITYELVRPDRGFRFVSEKVSHQPAIMACHATSLPLPEHGEHYTWTKVTTCMRNLIGGAKVVGSLWQAVVVNHSTKERVEITFKENGGGGWLGGGPSTANEVVGVGYSSKGEKVGVIRGRWSELCTVSRPGADDEGQVLWRANPVVATLRPVLRVDFERGNVDAAEAEKIRLEEKQRQYRKRLQEEGKEWGPDPVSGCETSWGGKREPIDNEDAHCQLPTARIHAALPSRDLSITSNPISNTMMVAPPATSSAASSAKPKTAAKNRHRRPVPGALCRRAQVALPQVQALDRFGLGQPRSLADFASAYTHFGFTKDPETGDIIYREYAPGATTAHLIGDFNNWDRASHPLTRDEFGTWSLRLPAGTIPHKSKVKIAFTSPQHVDGPNAQFDRISPWARHVVQDQSVSVAYDACIGTQRSKGRIASYREFSVNVIPKIAKLGYNTIQLMAVQEHAYYASFGYQLALPKSSWNLLTRPTPTAHVLLDLVHSHASKNVLDGLNMFDEPTIATSMLAPWLAFAVGLEALQLWPLRNRALFLSNVAYWLNEYMFDGFRFDGVTSMLYTHHGIGTGFSGNYHEYFGPGLVDDDAITYLMLANYLTHTLLPDVSGMPALCRPVADGGVGFDYRLGMAVPDMWIKYLKEFRDEQWDLGHVAHTLTNRRWNEATIGYAESHDQALVGDKTLAFWLMDKDMYDHMSEVHSKNPPPSIDRGMALHKMIRLVTCALSGEGYLTFMGNEFGHPEWLDFPRAGNNNSYHYARRQWSLATNEQLRRQFVTLKHEGDKVLAFERWDNAHKVHVLFIFNFHPTNSYTDYKVGVEYPGEYEVVLDTDAKDFGGHARLDHSVKYVAHANDGWNGRKSSVMVYSPSRSAIVLVNRNVKH
ncbi:hypothetical protein BCR44DRAFT_1515297 [Catenaria anguillulae PL171]|uniref:PH domain-containing protein n=1 Tax=Catenaria anguillulae PL171 TaxID=765915 RepID=A0A1Y2HDV3_9FUNG|nr:hypothetical protein BCR44DRAFT_1515297 [Catenaria anguillulae PL171]